MKDTAPLLESILACARCGHRAAFSAYGFPDRPTPRQNDSGWCPLCKARQVLTWSADASYSLRMAVVSGKSRK